MPYTLFLLYFTASAACVARSESKSAMQAKQKLLTSALLVAAVLLSATPSTAAATESMGGKT